MDEKNVQNPQQKAEAVKESVKQIIASPGQQQEGSSKKKALKYFIWILVVLVVTNPGLIPFLPSSIKATLTGATSKLFGDVTQIASVVSFNWVKLFQLVVMFLCLGFIHEMLFLIFAKLNPKTGRWKTLKNLFISAQRYIIVLVGFFWGLSILGMDVNTMLASLGIVALIIGFGAESMISDVVTGIFMIFENEYNVGDIVEVDGFRGTVDKIGIRTTCLRDNGGNIKVMNNGDIRNLVNQSEQGSVAVCDLAIPYEADLEEAKKVLEGELLPALKEHYPETFTGDVPRLLGLQELGDSAVVLRIIANVEESKRFHAVRQMNWDLKIGMEKHNMGVPYNQLVVRKEAE